MECDSRFANDIMKYNQWIDYLNGAYDNGMDGDNCYRNWYIALRGLTNAAYSENPLIRSAYDYAYQIMKGTYTPKNYARDYTSGVPTDRVGTEEIFEQRQGETGFIGDIFVDNASGNASNGGGGGSYYKDDVAKPVIGEPVSPEVAEKPSYEGYGWVEENGTYRYENTDGDYATGWVDVNNTWYYFDTEGDMETGWIRHGNRWYYLKESGAMATGWLKDNGKWYYLFDWGGMANNEWVYDNGWYYLRGNGEMLTGWLLEGDSWYYLKSNGLMVKDWNRIDGKWYFFYDSGRMAANETVNGYKVNASGAWVK